MDEVERMADMVTEYLPRKLPRTRLFETVRRVVQSDAFAIVSRAPDRMLSIGPIIRYHAVMGPPPA